MSTNVLEMFETSTASIEQKVESMAVFIAKEDDALAKLSSELAERKANLDQAKADLAMLMRQNGIEKISLANGLTPKATMTRKFFKAAGVDDEQMFGWLRENELGDIIKPYVHYQTLQGTLKAFTGEIPETIFNVSDVPSITMYGKTKFMAAQGVDFGAGNAS